MQVIFVTGNAFFENVHQTVSCQRSEAIRMNCHLLKCQCRFLIGIFSRCGSLLPPKQQNRLLKNEGRFGCGVDSSGVLIVGAIGEMSSCVSGWRSGFLSLIFAFSRSLSFASVIACRSVLIAVSSKAKSSLVMVRSISKLSLSMAKAN